MKINVRLFVGDSEVQFEEMDPVVQDEYRKQVTEIYAEQVLRMVINMIREGKSEGEIKEYLLLDNKSSKEIMSDKKSKEVSNSTSIYDELSMTLMDAV